MLPLVSIIVPSYQREKLLCETIGYLLAQDYPNRELLIVDQSSNHEPETARYLDSIAGQVRYFHLAQPNLPAARNFGIRQSKGEIVVFFDDDLVIPPNTVSQLIPNYSNSDVWGLTGLVVSSSDPDRQIRSAYGKFVRREKTLFEGVTIRIGEFIGGFMSFRKAIFSRVGLFDSWIGTQPLACNEDLEFCRRVSVAGYGLYLDTRIRIHHVALAEGGYMRRNFPPEALAHHQLRLHLYSLLKNRSYRGWAGWVHAALLGYRGYMLNRGLLRMGPFELVRKHTIFQRALKEAREDVVRNCDSTREILSSIAGEYDES